METGKGGVILNPPLLITTFGRAKVDTSGYYRITSRREGNHLKLLHRLIFEKFHGGIPEGYIVHHKDGDKINNCILNLELLSLREHIIHHDKGNDAKHRKICLARNNTGYRRVSIKKCDSCKQGFIYYYRYYDDEGNHKSIVSVNFDILKEKVLSKGLLWEKFEDSICEEI